MSWPGPKTMLYLAYWLKNVRERPRSNQSNKLFISELSQKRDSAYFSRELLFFLSQGREWFWFKLQRNSQQLT